MKIDFSRLNAEAASVFRSNKQEVLSDYIKMTDVLQRRSTDLSWLLNNVTSRNTNFSNLFYYMRCEKLLYDLSKENSIDEVCTDDPLLAKLISPQYNITCNNNAKEKNFYYSVYHCIKWSIYALLCKSKKRLTFLRDIQGATIIDTDIAKKADKYNDRYYGDVLDSLPKEVTSDFFYNIIYLPYPQKKDILIIDKNTPYNTVYLWDFLELSDYVSALIRMLKRNKKSLLDYEYLGINQRPVLEAVYKDSISFYYYLAYLYERVIYRMKKNDIKIRLYVDWFENQSFDKSFHWAMAKYYPDTEVHSYIGFMADTKENPITIATNTELDLNIAPKRIFTCNEALKAQYLNSGYHGIVNKAPFYRANNIWKITKSKEINEKFTILVPLGLNKSEVYFKTKFFVSLLYSNSFGDINVLIKPHPVYNESSIRQLIDGCEGISIIGGNIYDYLPKADAVVASNSTTTYEALALGIPLLYLVDPEYKLSLNRPEKVPGIMWNEIKDNESFVDSINSIKSIDAKQFNEEGNKLKEYYFTNNSVELTNKLFNIV